MAQFSLDQKIFIFSHFWKNKGHMANRAEDPQNQPSLNIPPSGLFWISPFPPFWKCHTFPPTLIMTTVTLGNCHIWYPFPSWHFHTLVPVSSLILEDESLYPSHKPVVLCFVPCLDHYKRPLHVVPVPYECTPIFQTNSCLVFITLSSIFFQSTTLILPIVGLFIWLLSIICLPTVGLVNSLYCIPSLI